jgi:hypothetical protein
LGSSFTGSGSGILGASTTGSAFLTFFSFLTFVGFTGSGSGTGTGAGAGAGAGFASPIFPFFLGAT